MLGLLKDSMSTSQNSVTESAKAAQEIAKTTGKAIDATREAGGFIARYIGGSLEQAVGIFEDKLCYMRWERQLRLMRRAEETLKEVGLATPTKSLPMKLLVPLLQGAAMEEDDQLQDRWVNLLINSCNEAAHIDLQHSFIDILERLTPLEAQMLDCIYSLPYEKIRHDGVITENLPYSAKVGTDTDQEDVPPSEAVQIGLANLALMGCVRLGLSMGGGEFFGRINPTFLGILFVQACRAPIKA